MQFVTNLKQFQIHGQISQKKNCCKYSLIAKFVILFDTLKNYIPVDSGVSKIVHTKNLRNSDFFVRLA